MLIDYETGEVTKSLIPTEIFGEFGEDGTYDYISDVVPRSLT